MLILSLRSFQPGREVGVSVQFSLLRQTVINVIGVATSIDGVQTRERACQSGDKIQLCALK